MNQLYFGNFRKNTFFDSSFKATNKYFYFSQSKKKFVKTFYAFFFKNQNFFCKKSFHFCVCKSKGNNNWSSDLFTSTLTSTSKSSLSFLKPLRPLPQPLLSEAASPALLGRSCFKRKVLAQTLPFAYVANFAPKSQSMGAKVDQSCKAWGQKLKATPKILKQNFYNRSFDKGRLKTLISWSVFYFGEKKTIDLVEKLKTIGYAYATKAGISLSIDDLKIPISKKNYVCKAEQILNFANQQVKKGRLTSMEYFSKVIETWNKTSENLKDEVIDNFKKTDELNPVFLMAFSGARGNISQVRQLTSMRGLMSDPQGRIINFPIQSNFREGLTLTEYLISCHGARKGVVDTALRTATSGYLTRRLVDVAHHVIIRGFDCGTQKGILLTDFKKGSKILIALKNRLVGRRLAEDIWTNKNELIGTRNQEIDASLGLAISKTQNSVLIRSPLTCEKGNFVCQLCYGWSLASHRLVSLGEAVGVIAAQSIGEPGTQLTMRTFHTGGVFSGEISEEIKTPVTGVVTFPNSIPGKLVRTAYGQIAFLTKQNSVLNVIPQNLDLLNNTGNQSKLNPIQIKIPAYALLFAKQKQNVEKNQVLAETSTFLNEESYSIASYQTLYSEFSGQFKLEKPKNQIQIAKDKLEIEIDKFENLMTAEKFEALFFKEKAKIRKKIANFKKIRNSIFQSTQSGITQEFWLFAAENQMVAKPVNLLIQPGDFVYSNAPIYLLQTPDLFYDTNAKENYVFSSISKKKSFLNFFSEKTKEKSKKVVFFDFGRNCAIKAFKKPFFLNFTFFNEKNYLKKGKCFLVQKKSNFFKVKNEIESFYPFEYSSCKKKTDLVNQKLKIFFKAALQKKKSLLINYPLSNLSFFNSNFFFTKLAHSIDLCFQSEKNFQRFEKTKKHKQQVSNNLKLFKQVGFSSLFKTKTGGFGIQDFFYVTFASSLKTTSTFLLFQFVSSATNVLNLTPQQNVNFAVQNLNFYYFETPLTAARREAASLEEEKLLQTQGFFAKKVSVKKKKLAFFLNFHKNSYTCLKKNKIKTYFKNSHLLKFYYFWNLTFFKNIFQLPSTKLTSNKAWAEKKKKTNYLKLNLQQNQNNSLNLKKKIEIWNWKIQSVSLKNVNDFQTNFQSSTHSLSLPFSYNFLNRFAFAFTKAKEKKIFSNYFTLFFKPVLRSSFFLEHSLFTKTNSKKHPSEQSFFASLDETKSIQLLPLKKQRKQVLSNFYSKNQKTKLKNFKSKVTSFKNKDCSKILNLSHPFFKKKNLLFLKTSLQLLPLLPPGFATLEQSLRPKQRKTHLRKVSHFSTFFPTKSFELESQAFVNTVFLMKQKKKIGKQEFLLTIFLEKSVSRPNRLFWFSQNKKSIENLDFVKNFKHFNLVDLADFQKNDFLTSYFYEAFLSFTKKYLLNRNQNFLIAVKTQKNFASKILLTNFKPVFFTKVKEKSLPSFKIKSKVKISLLLSQNFFQNKTKKATVASVAPMLCEIDRLLPPCFATLEQSLRHKQRAKFAAKAKEDTPKLKSNFFAKSKNSKKNFHKYSFYFIKKSELFSALIEYQILRNLKKMSLNLMFNKKPNLLKYFLVLTFLLKKAYFLNFQSEIQNLFIKKLGFFNLNLQRFETLDLMFNSQSSAALTEKNVKKQKNYSKSKILLYKKQLGFQTKNFSNFLNCEPMKRELEKNCVNNFHFLAETQKKQTSKVTTQVTQQASFFDFQNQLFQSLSNLFFVKVSKKNPEEIFFALFFKNKLNYYQNFAYFPLVTQMQNRAFKNLKAFLFESRFKKFLLNSNFFKLQSSFNVEQITLASNSNILKNLKKYNHLSVNSVLEKDFFHFLFISKILEVNKKTTAKKKKKSEKILSLLYLVKKKRNFSNVFEFLKKKNSHSKKIGQKLTFSPKIYFKYKSNGIEKKNQTLILIQNQTLVLTKNNKKNQKKSWSNFFNKKKNYDFSKFLISKQLLQAFSQINAVAKQHQYQPFKTFNPTWNTCLELQTAQAKKKMTQNLAFKARLRQKPVYGPLIFEKPLAKQFNFQKAVVATLQQHASTFQQKQLILEFEEKKRPVYENWVFPLVQPQATSCNLFFHIPGNLKLNDISFGNFNVLTGFFYSGFHKNFCEVNNNLNFWVKTVESFKLSHQKKLNFSKKKLQIFFKKRQTLPKNQSLVQNLISTKQKINFEFVNKKNLATQFNFDKTERKKIIFLAKKNLFLENKLKQYQKLQKFQNSFQSKKKRVCLNDIFFKNSFPTKKRCQNLFIIHPLLIWKKGFEKNLQHMLTPEALNIQVLNWIFKKNFVSFSNKNLILFQKVELIKAFLVFFSKSFQLFSGNIFAAESCFQKSKKKKSLFFKKNKKIVFFGASTIFSFSLLKAKQFLNFNPDFLDLSFNNLNPQTFFERKKKNKKTLSKYCRLYNFKTVQLPFFSTSFFDFFANLEKKTKNLLSTFAPFTFAAKAKEDTLRENFFDYLKYIKKAQNQRDQKKQLKFTKQQTLRSKQGCDQKVRGLNQKRVPLLNEAAFHFNSNSRFQPKLLILITKDCTLKFKANNFYKLSSFNKAPAGPVKVSNQFLFENKNPFYFLSSSARILFLTQKSTQLKISNKKKTKKETFLLLDKSNLLKKKSGNWRKTTLINSKFCSPLPNLRLQIVTWKNCRNLDFVFDKGQKNLKFDYQNWTNLKKNWAVAKQPIGSQKTFSTPWAPFAPMLCEIDQAKFAAKAKKSTPKIKFFEKKQNLSPFFNFKIQPALQVFWTFFNLNISKKKHREKFLLSSTRKTDFSQNFYQAGTFAFAPKAKVQTPPKKFKIYILNLKLEALKAIDKTFLLETQIFPFPFKVFWPKLSLLNFRQNLLKFTLNSNAFNENQTLRSKQGCEQILTSGWQFLPPCFATLEQSLRQKQRSKNFKLNFKTFDKTQNLTINLLSCFKLLKQKNKFLYAMKKKNYVSNFFSFYEIEKTNFLFYENLLLEVNENTQENLNFKQQNKKSKKNLTLQENKKNEKINPKNIQIRSNSFYPQIKAAQNFSFSKQFKYLYSQQSLNLVQFHFDTTLLNQSSLDFLYNLQPLKKKLFQKNFKTTSLFLLEKQPKQLLNSVSKIKTFKKTNNQSFANKSFSTILNFEHDFDCQYVKKGLSFLKGEVFMAKKSPTFKFVDLFLFKKALPEIQVLTSDNLLTFGLKSDFDSKQKSTLLQEKSLSNCSYQQNKKLSENKFSLSIGQIVRYGQELNSSVALKSSGQIILLQSDKMVLRYAKPFLLPRGARYDLVSGDFVKKQSSLLTLKYRTLKTEDIVQGIPKVEQLFEARENTQEKLGVNALLKKKFKEFQNLYSSSISVQKSFEYIQKYIINGIQSVYQSQGVNISDKHIEIIVKQMTSKVQIRKPYASGLFSGDIVYLADIEKVNLAIKTQNYAWNQKNPQIDQMIKKISFLKTNQKSVFKIQTLEQLYISFEKKLPNFENKRVYFDNLLNNLREFKSNARKMEKTVGKITRNFQKIKKKQSLLWELESIKTKKTKLEKEFQNYYKNKSYLESENLERDFRKQIQMQNRELKKLDRKLNFLKELEIVEIQKKNLEEKLQNFEKLKKLNEIQEFKLSLKTLTQVQKSIFKKFNQNLNYKLENINFQILREELEIQHKELKKQREELEIQRKKEVDWQQNVKLLKKNIQFFETSFRQTQKKLGLKNELRDFKKEIENLEKLRLNLEKAQLELENDHLKYYKNKISSNFETEQLVRQQRKTIKLKIRKLRRKIKTMDREIKFDCIAASLLRRSQKNLELPFVNQIEYEPIVLGITKASLLKAGFLSAASFQETIKILTKAPLFQQGDFLRGLKENVILGHLIPAGTGSGINVVLSNSKISNFAKF
uniref:DNA-directed RNA polymerase subunit beta'' n=1 Tax=Rhexinema sarcinoideum TaxID=43261 RepID=A0A1B2RYP6_9CHLO|nr:beta'' subunit of RNA polymerase [Rhexinema sarcinoideum]